MSRAAPWTCGEQRNEYDIGFGRQDLRHLNGQVIGVWIDALALDYAAAGALGSGRIDHFCLNCDGLADFVERLTTNGVEFSERKAHNSNLYQLFMREPVNGIKVELNFDAEEAISSGRVPEWTSAGANEAAR